MRALRHIIPARRGSVLHFHAVLLGAVGLFGMILHVWLHGKGS
jgi:hypothetical protein